MRREKYARETCAWDTRAHAHLYAAWYEFLKTKKKRKEETRTRASSWKILNNILVETLKIPFKRSLSFQRVSFQWILNESTGKKKRIEKRKVEERWQFAPWLKSSLAWFNKESRRCNSANKLSFDPSSIFPRYPLCTPLRRIFPEGEWKILELDPSRTPINIPVWPSSFTGET